MTALGVTLTARAASSFALGGATSLGLIGEGSRKPFSPGRLKPPFSDIANRLAFSGLATPFGTMLSQAQQTSARRTCETKGGKKQDMSEVRVVHRAHQEPAPLINDTVTCDVLQRTAPQATPRV